MNDDEKNTLSHEALLRELLHIDNLVEKHSQLVIGLCPGRSCRLVSG
jgi:hypothetical protein